MSYVPLFFPAGHMEATDCGVQAARRNPGSRPGSVCVPGHLLHGCRGVARIGRYLLRRELVSPQRHSFDCGNQSHSRLIVLLDRYTHALQALSHAMVLAPQNPFYVLQFADTAASNGEFSLALKMYLRSAEMIEEDEEDGFRHDENQVARKAWLGVQEVSDICTPGWKGVPHAVMPVPTDPDLHFAHPETVHEAPSGRPRVGDDKWDRPFSEATGFERFASAGSTGQGADRSWQQLRLESDGLVVNVCHCVAAAILLLHSSGIITVSRSFNGLF